MYLFYTLQPIELFLLFDLLAQLLLGRHIKHIFRSEQTVVVVQYGIAGDVLVRFRTEDDADGRIVALAAHTLIVHPDVHIHLSHVLVRDGRRLEVDQYERFEDIVVENEVYKIVLFLGTDQLLPRHERETFTQFEQEFLQISDDRSL